LLIPETDGETASVVSVRGERRAVPPELGIVREVGAWPVSTATISATPNG